MARLALVVVFVLALVAIGAFLLKRRRPQQKTDFKTTEELMAYLADEAVADAAKNNNTKLDYSIESIERAEEVLGRLHDQYIADKSSLSVSGLAMAYGAYVAEVIRRDNPDSRWVRDHAVAGEKSYPLHWLGGESFPCAWCFKRITNGPEDNVWHKYLVLKEQRLPGTTQAPPIESGH